MSMTINRYYWLAARIMVVVSLCIMFPDTSLIAQNPECEYLATKLSTPSIEHSREMFRVADLACAELELRDLLGREDLTQRQRADAHVLLASIHFVVENDEQIRRQLVKRELVEAFLADRQWDGQLEIVAHEFRAVFADARELVEWRYQNSPELVAAEDEIKAIENLQDDSTGALIESAKPWYKRWWAIGSGVGLVAITILITSGDESTVEPNQQLDTLPGFPSDPGD